MPALIQKLKSTIQNSQAGRKRGRLVRHYFLISLVLISGGLITSGISELYFRHRESAADLVRLQQEITSGAASKIEQFVQEIERTTKGVARSREITEQGLSPEYQFELRRLLAIAPAITEAVAFDSDGISRIAVSRLTELYREMRKSLPRCWRCSWPRKESPISVPSTFIAILNLT
jgi:hypothetical protein